jgi:kynurenine formamidase
MSRFIDLSHIVENGMVTYQGLPAPVISDYLTREESRKHYAPGTEFHIGRIEMVANTGTYLDSPFHRYAHGRDLSELPLESLAGLEGMVIRAPQVGERVIGPEVLASRSGTGRAILFHTGWARHWGTPQYFSDHPFVSEDLARALVEARVMLVGIDSYNIDDTRDPSRPAHTLLLGADIPVVEHMTGLVKLPEQGFKFFAVPVKVRKFGTFPVRAFAIVDE